MQSYHMMIDNGKNAWTFHFQYKEQDHSNTYTMTKEQRKVLKRFPDAKLSYDDNGYKVISINGYEPAKDYFMPDTMDTDKAWEYASVACRTTQQFNRTHPLKIEIDFGGEEAKNMRIERRKRNGKKSKK
jgi:hypothetical protein